MDRIVGNRQVAVVRMPEVVVAAARQADSVVVADWEAPSLWAYRPCDIFRTYPVHWVRDSDRIVTVADDDRDTCRHLCDQVPNEDVRYVDDEEVQYSVDSTRFRVLRRIHADRNGCLTAMVVAPTSCHCSAVQKVYPSRVAGCQDDVGIGVVAVVIHGDGVAAACVDAVDDVDAADASGECRSLEDHQVPVDVRTLCWAADRGNVRWAPLLNRYFH